MRRTFENATLLCGQDFEEVRGYIEVKEGIISEIGEGKSSRKDAIDVKRGLICPSFTNSHVHLGDSIAMDEGTYAPLKERVGGGGIKFSELEKHGAKVGKAIADSLAEMKAGGTAAFCDFREGGIKGVQILKAVLDPFFDSRILGRPDDGNLKELLKLCDGVGISSVNNYSAIELKNITEEAKKRQKQVGVHAGESGGDIKKAVELKPDFLVHLTNATEEELELVFKKKLPVVLCARANAMFGAGLPRIKEVFENTLVALGTDNVMANPPDMFREMEFVFKAERGIYKDHEFKAEEVLRAATINGRKLLGLPDNTLSVGNEANFFVAARGEYARDPAIQIIHRTGVRGLRHLVKGDSLIL